MMSNTLEYMIDSRLLRRGKINSQELSHRNDTRIRRENMITLSKNGFVIAAVVGGLLSSIYLIGNNVIPPAIDYIAREIFGEDSESIKYAPTDELWKSRER